MPQVAAAAVFAAAGTAASSFAAGAFAAAAGTSFIAAGIANVSIAAVVVSGVLGAAAAGLQLAMAKKPGGAPAGPGVSIAQPTPVLEDVYGRTRVGGYFAFFRETETNKKRNISAVIVLAAHEIDAVEEVWFDDQLGVSGGLLRPEFSDRIAAFEVRLGAPGQSAPSSLIAAQSGIVDANFKLTGKPYIYVELRDVKKKWPKGMPSIWAVVRGKKVFDPRTGQTAWTDNWALICADYVKTRGKLKAEYIKAPGLIAAANLCDEMVDGHKRYTFNGKIATNRPARDVLPEMRRYAVADTVWLGDEFLILPGAYSAPVRTFTKRDFKSAITLTSEALVEDRWDRVEGTYGPVASYYNPTGISGLTFDDYNPAQGDPRVLQVDVPNEQVHVRAQRCIFLAAKQTRRQRGAKFAIAPTPENLALLPYQRVVLDYPEVGLSGVWQLRTLPTLLDSEKPRIEVEVLEDGPDFWSWNGSLATAAPPSQTTSLPNAFIVQPATAPVTATPRVRIEADGSATQWIEVTWGESDDFYLREYEVQWVQDGVTRSQRVPGTRYDILNASAGQVVSITVYAVNTFGLLSAGLSPGASTTPIQDTTSPGVPSLLDIRGAVGRVNFTVRGPVDPDTANIRLYETSSGGAFGTATEVLRVPCAPNGRVEFSRENMALGVARRFWLTAADRTGNESGPVGPFEATPRKLIADEIGEALLTPTMFTQETLDLIGGEGAATTAAAEAAANAAAAARAAAEAAAQDALDIANGLEGGVQLAQEAAEAARDAALNAAEVAETASYLAVQVGTGSVITDTRFRDWNVSWTRWNGPGGTGATVTATPQPGGNAITLTCAADQQVGLYTTSLRPVWSGITNAEAYVVELDMTTLSGSLSGAGVLLDWDQTTEPSDRRVTVPFSAMYASGTGRVRYQAIFRRPTNANLVFYRHDVYVMVNYGVGLGALAAKSVIVHEVRLRPATAEELGTGQIGAVITAAVSAETTSRNLAIANETTARTAAINSAISEVRGGSTRSLAQIDDDQATKVTEAQAQAAAGTRISSELLSGGAIKSAIDAAAAAITGPSTRTLAQIDSDQATKVTAAGAQAAADTRISAQLLTGGTIRGALDSTTTSLTGLIDAKGVVIYATTAPASASERRAQNLWIDTGGSPARNLPHRWNGSAWVAVPDAGIAAALTEAQSKGRVIYATAAPTAVADRQTQNLWIDTGGSPARNDPYRWNGSAWVKIEPAALTTAKADISTLQTTKVDAAGAQAIADTRIIASLAPGGAVKTAVDSTATALTAAYTAADGALGIRTTNLETSINTPVTGIAARLTTTETAVTNETEARIAGDQTLRAEVLKTASDSRVIDDVLFRDYGVVGTPSWSRWNGTNGASASVVASAQNGGQSITFICSSDQQVGLYLTSTRLTWSGPTNATAFVVEVEVTLSTGTIDGAGVVIDWRNTVPAAYRTSLRLSAMQAQGQGRVRYQAIFRKPVSFVGTFSHHDVYFMANWSSFTPVAAKTITVHRFLIRPATAEELGTGAVGEVITAAVSAETTNRNLAIANETSARTAAIAAAKSEITGGSTVTIAQQQTVIGTKVDANGAIAAVDGRVSAASGGEYASVQEMTAAQTLLDEQARAFKYVRVETNGNVATSFIGASDDGSDINFTADRFTVNGESVFQVDGGVVRMGDARVKRLSIGEQEVDLRALEQNTLVQTHASGVSSFVLISTTPASHPILGLDISFPVGARGARVTGYMRCWYNGRQGNFNYAPGDDYGLRFRGQVYWPGGGSDFRDQEFSRGLYVDEFSQVKSRGSREVVLTFPAIEARAGTNLARLWAIYSDANRDESFAWMQLWLTVVNN